MVETKQQENREILDNKPAESYPDFEAKQNLLGFFELLLRVDMRNHPERYKKPNNPQKEND